VPARLINIKYITIRAEKVASPVTALHSRNSNGRISVVRDATVTWLSVPIVLHVLCMLPWPWPDPRSSQGHGPFELPTIAHNYTFLGLSPPPLSRGAKNWRLTLIVWETWSTACRSPIFEFLSRKGIATVHTSRNVDISRHSNGHIFRYCVKIQSHGWVCW